MAGAPDRWAGERRRSVSLGVGGVATVGEHEAERVTGGVDVHPERLARLHLGLSSAQREHLLLADVEVVDVEIEVQLLRVLVARPLRWHVTRRLLEGDGRAAVARQLRPLVVDVADRPARDRGVELGERGVVGAVDARPG